MSCGQRALITLFYPIGALLPPSVIEHCCFFVLDYHSFQSVEQPSPPPRLWAKDSHARSPSQYEDKGVYRTIFTNGVPEMYGSPRSC